MRRTWACWVALLACCPSLWAQIGKSVAVAAGTPEDKALSEIYAASDPAQKIALLEKFMAEYGKGDLALLGDQLLTGAYLEEKNYDKVFEYGEKALAIDPENLATAVTMVHAAAAKGDTGKLFEMGESVAGILARYKASPAPAGTSAEDWERQKTENLKGVQNDVGYVEYTLFSAAAKTADPAARAAFLARFAALFPASSYSEAAGTNLALTYQQAEEFPKMVAAAQKVLAANPENPQMLLLLSDYWSERGQELDRAEGYAKKALEALAGAKKPEGVSEEDWQRELALQKGLAYSALGQIYVTRGRNAQAVDAFKQADPLLKSNAFSYGRNLYRLGFTLAKMQRLAEARTVLTEAISVNSPYRRLAQETLGKIGGPLRRRRH